MRSALHRAKKKLETQCEDVRWTPTQQLHLTVRFIGEVKDSEVNDVAGAVTRSAKACPRFDLKVGNMGCFPSRGQVRAIWAGVELTDHLKRCADAIEHELDMLGFDEDRRPFAPHITLGRTRRDGSQGATRRVVEQMTLAHMSQPVKSLTLMSSALTKSGPIYAPACIAKLANV